MGLELKTWLDYIIAIPIIITTWAAVMVLLVTLWKVVHDE